MFKSRAPLFFSETEVVVVDDNKNFTRSLELLLSHNKHTKIRCFNFPEEAETYLEGVVDLNDAQFQSSLETIQETEGDTDRIYSFLNYNKIFPFKKNTIVSVLISDFSMPKTSGIEFLEKYKYYHPVKILLTGEADSELAVKAFNNKVIDYFYLKGTSSNKDLLNNLNDLVVDFFLNVSDALDKTFYYLRGNCEFIKLINAWMKENDIKSYCFYHDSGSILGLDEFGIEYWFLMLNEEQYNDSLEMLKSQGVEEKVLNLVKDKKIMYVTPTEHTKLQSIEECSKFFFSIEGSFRVRLGQKIYYSTSKVNLSPEY